MPVRNDNTLVAESRAIPQPGSSESETDFMARCMGNETMGDEFPDHDQRLAVCMRTWTDAHGRANRDMIEHRVIQFGQGRLEIRQAGADQPTFLSGYAAVFDAESSVINTPWGSFTETIRAGAFDSSLAAGSDVRCCLNHDPTHLLGRRSAGTLDVRVDQVGLRYSVELPQTQIGRDLAVSIQRGDIRGSSFAFRVLGEDGERVTMQGRDVRRELLAVDILELGPVTYPAYPGTEDQLSLRCVQMLRRIGQQTTAHDLRRRLDLAILT